MKLTRIKAGDKFVVREGAYNAFCDAAERLAPNVIPAGATGTAAGGNVPALVVKVKNNTSEQFEAFRTFSADHSLSGQSGQLTIERNEFSVSQSPIVAIGQVNKEDGPPHLLILQEPIPAGSIGSAVIRGVCIARVDILSSSHTYADLPLTGSVLKSGFGGRVRILQVESASLGEQNCLVDLLQSGIGSQMVYISAGPTSGLYTGFYYQQNTESPYNQFSTGVEVRAIPIGGGTLQTGRIYFGTTLGTVTVSDTPYDLVSLVGDANFTATSGGNESAWTGGLVNTTTQSFKGNKYFRGPNAYFQDLATYPTSYCQISSSGSVFLTNGTASVYSTCTINGQGITFVYADGTYTNVGYLSWYTAGSSTEDFLMIESNNVASGYNAVITRDQWGVLSGGAVKLGITASLFGIPERNAGGTLIGTHYFEFHGGLCTQYYFA